MMSDDSEQAVGSTLDTPLWVVVPAAGVGQRLGGKLAKQYQLLHGVAMLERTLQQLRRVPGVAGIVVVLAEHDPHWATLSLSSEPLFHTVIGGATRAQSVMAGIDYVLQQADEKSWVMVHDAARPLVAISDIQRLVDAVYNSGATGGLLATPVQDSLKRADDYATVEQSVDRAGLWQAQTPQLFRVGELHGALQSAMQSNDNIITDESSAMEIAGHDPLLVEALQANFKITRTVDWQIATALLREQSDVEQGSVS